MNEDARLQHLLDRQEIEDLLVRVCRGIDRHDAQYAKAAFHEGALDDHATFIGTGPDMIDWAEAMHEQTLRNHQHYISNITVDIDGDEAHAESYVMVAGVQKGAYDSVLGGGRYLDRLERREGRWGIVDRVLIVEWWGDASTMESIAAVTVSGTWDRNDPSYARPLKVTRPFHDVAAQTAAFE